MGNLQSLTGRLSSRPEESRLPEPTHHLTLPLPDRDSGPVKGRLVWVRPLVKRF